MYKKKTNTSKQLLVQIYTFTSLAIYEMLNTKFTNKLLLQIDDFIVS